MCSLGLKSRVHEAFEKIKIIIDSNKANYKHESKLDSKLDSLSGTTLIHQVMRDMYIFRENIKKYRSVALLFKDACKIGSLDIIEYLVSNEKYISETGGEVIYPGFRDSYTSGSDVDSVNKIYKEGLLCASFFGRLEIIKYLCEITDKIDVQHMIENAQQNSHMHVIKFMLDTYKPYVDYKVEDTFNSKQVKQLLNMQIDGKLLGKKAKKFIYKRNQLLAATYDTLMENTKLPKDVVIRHIYPFIEY